MRLPRPAPRVPRARACPTFTDHRPSRSRSYGQGEEPGSSFRGSSIQHVERHRLARTEFLGAATEHDILVAMLDCFIAEAVEAIKHGYQDVMLGGGAEELCPSEAMAFDMLYATSQRNDDPASVALPVRS